MAQPDFGSATQAKSVADEYRIVRETSCGCGARYAVRSQELLSDPAGKPYDRLNTQCPKCGATRQFLFDISSFFGRSEEQAAGAGEARPSPTKASLRMALGLCILVFLLGACVAVGPLRPFADAQARNAGFMIMVLFGAGAVWVYWKKATLPAQPADETALRDAQRTLDGRAEEMESVLARHGIVLDWSVSSPEKALIGGAAKATIFQGCKALEAERPDDAIAEFSRAVKLLESDAAGFSELLAAACCLLGAAHEKKGAAAEALEDYRRALKISPNCAAAAEACRRLEGHAQA